MPPARAGDPRRSAPLDAAATAVSRRILWPPSFSGGEVRVCDAPSARPDANRRAVEAFAARLDVLPFDDTAASHAGEIRADLERQGAAIGGYDVMIAGFVP